MKPAAFLLLLFALCFSPPLASQQPGSNSLHGVWEGDLDVVYAPDFPDGASSLAFRLEINDREVRFSIYLDEQNRWSPFSAPQAVGSFRRGAMYVINNHQSGFNESLSVNVVQLDEERLYVYVSRVVDNFAAKPDQVMRHFPVFSKGEMRRAALQARAVR
ncbi:MAG: hypothetical protein AAF660_16105 [Pseudomonadota bacterium]